MLDRYVARMLFQFSKLYLDFVSSDNTVVIVYLSTTTVLGVRLPQCMIEVYRPDGTFTSLRGRWDKRSDIGKMIDDGEFKVVLPGGSGLIRYEPIDGLWHPGGEIMAEHLRWNVVGAAANVSLDLDLPNQREQFEGVGYADLTQLDKFPKKLGIKHLEWGRVHWPGATLVFDAVTFNNGRRWCRVGNWDKSGFSELKTCFTMEQTGTSRRLILPEHIYLFEPLRVLHHGAAVDGERFPNLIERTFFNFIAGPVQETRWLSAVQDSTHAIPGKAVHEQVSFESAGV